MSQTNVDIVRDVIDAWNRRDWDAAFRDTAPDFTVDTSTTSGEWRGVHTGRAQVQRTFETLTDAWESGRLEIEECFEAGDDVVTRQTAYLRGRGGIEVTARTSCVWKFRDGTLTELGWFNEHADALAAVGKRETETD